jgi:hypothetical protein
VLTVHGAGFGAGTVVRWQGKARPTTVVDGFTLTAVIPSTDTAALGQFAITAYDAGRGLESTAVMFTVVPQLHHIYLPVVVR